MNEDNSTPGESNSEPIKVILADENAADQENFKAAIYNTNIKADVTSAADGQELMDNLNDKDIPNPDIIFMEVNMQMDNGKDCLEEIKKDEVLKDIPTVMYTETDSKEKVNESFSAGATLYVFKPVFFRNLVRVLIKIFSMNWVRLIVNPMRKNFVISEESVSEKAVNNQLKNP